MKFFITVCRTSYAFHTIEVEAEDLNEAENKALEEAGDHEYLEKSAEYSVD